MCLHGGIFDTEPKFLLELSELHQLCDQPNASRKYRRHYKLFSRQTFEQRQMQREEVYVSHS